jgi:hypothetical protein
VSDRFTRARNASCAIAWSPSDRPAAKIQHHTYQLVFTQQLQIPDDLGLIWLLQTSSADAGEEDISIIRTNGGMAQEI